MISERPRYYRRDGTPYNGVLDWAVDFEKADRTIERSRLWWGGFVSTVWMGLDHSFGGGPPLIFETMVFAPKNSSVDQDRYTTEGQARIGHQQIAKKWRKVSTLIKWQWESTKEFYPELYFD